jgi:hypothetical protein
MRYSKASGLTMALVAATMILPVLGNGQALRDMAAGEVASMPQEQVTADNSDASGLLIQSASAVEITRAQFERLTNAKASVDTYISCPRITVVNNTGRAIAWFTIMLFNSVSKNIESETTYVGLQPAEEFTVKPLTQASHREGLANRGTYTVDPNDGKVRPQGPSKAGWDSQGAWVPGALGDFSIVVAQIRFADGTIWTINR